jgi:hypothetical protein
VGIGGGVMEQTDRTVNAPWYYKGSIHQYIWASYLFPAGAAIRVPADLQLPAERGGFPQSARLGNLREHHLPGMVVPVIRMRFTG